MKNKKVFYTVNRFEYLNDDYLVSARYGNLIYGELSKAEKEPVTWNIEDYDELINKVLEAKKIKNKDVYPELYVEKHFGKYWLYDSGQAWVWEGCINAGRISRKTFKKYTVKVEVKIVKPTIKDLINHIALEDALDYIEHLDNKKQVLLEVAKNLKKKLEE